MSPGSLGPGKASVNPVCGMTELTTAMVNEAVNQLGRVQGELLDLSERLRAAQDVAKRTEIVAPQAGTIVGLRVHTAGGVISPGQALLDIVPSGDRLIVEAHVDPQDIDIVHEGLNAHVRFTSFSQRNAVPIAGRVISVSADRLTDERSGASYYLAKVELTEDPRVIFDGAELYPGMPAEVMIVYRQSHRARLPPTTDYRQSAAFAKGELGALGATETAAKPPWPGDGSRNCT